MEVQLSNSQLIIRPSGSRGIELQVLTHKNIRLGALLEIYKFPCLEISIPLFTFYLGWFNRKEHEKLDRFFSMEEDSNETIK